MVTARFLLGFGAALLVLGAAPQAFADTVPAEDAAGAPELAPDRVAALVADAIAHADSPQRRIARDALFRDVLPVLRATGRAATAVESRALVDVISRQPCTTGPPRVVDSAVGVGLAWVALAGTRGGCTWLARQTPDGAWQVLMPLGWTLGS